MSCDGETYHISEETSLTVIRLLRSKRSPRVGHCFDVTCSSCGRAQDEKATLLGVAVLRGFIGEWAIEVFLIAVRCRLVKSDAGDPSNEGLGLLLERLACDYPDLLFDLDDVVPRYFL